MIACYIKKGELHLEKRICLLIAFSLLCSLAGCSSSEEPADSSSALQEQSSSSVSSVVENVSSEEASSSSSSEPDDEISKLKASLLADQKLYPDAVAWLYVPGTDISDSVMQGKDNSTYHHKNKAGEKIGDWATDDCLMMDYESLLGDGTPSGISQNTIIYGFNYGTWNESAEKSGWKAYVDKRRAEGEEHSVINESSEAFALFKATDQLTGDDPDAPGFSQLLRFADVDFAKEHPYIHLVTPAQALTFEIFMAGYTDAYTDPFYIDASYSDEDFTQLIQNMKSYSLYNYEREVAPSDRILTLSTDTFRFPGMVGKNRQGRPNNARSKFVVMAALVETDGPFHESARLELNPSPKQPNLVERTKD